MVFSRLVSKDVQRRACARKRSLWRRRAKEGYRSTEGRAVEAGRHWLGRRIIFGPSSCSLSRTIFIIRQFTLQFTCIYYLYLSVFVQVTKTISYASGLAFVYLSWLRMKTMHLTTKDTASRQHMHSVIQ